MKKQFKHIMIDLETLGLEPTSIIRSCAVVEFDPETGETGESKEWKVNMQQSYDAGFTLSIDTIRWWMKQSEEVRKQFVDENETGLSDFLLQLRGFLVSHGEDFTLWCLQLDFDLPILRNHYHKFYKGTSITKEYDFLPWNRLKIRDVRPYMDALESAGLLPPKVKDRHTPMADCLAQINYVHLAIKNNLTIR